jgi:hypothetical protein
MSNPTGEALCEQPFVACVPKELPPEELLAAATDAVLENPANAPPEGAARMAAMMSTAIVGDEESDKLIPQRIAFLTGMYWGSGGVDLTTGFMEPLSNELRDKFMHYLNVIGAEGGRKFANVRFRWTQTDPLVRITREGDGYWSYLGVGIKRIPRNQPTMCLSRFTLQTSEAEWRRVVPHEGLHSCGAPHEHLRRALVQRINAEKAYAYFARMGWDRATTQSNVLTPLDERSIMGTPTAEEDSAMAYWLPGEIMNDGRPILGGKYLTDGDRAFIAKIYPLAIEPPEPPTPPPATGNKVYVELTGTITGGKQVAFPTDNTKAHVIVSTQNDPGAVTVTTTIPSTNPPTNPNGGSAMWLRLLKILMELLARFGEEAQQELDKAKAAGEITAEEHTEACAQLQQMQGQMQAPPKSKK